MNRLLVWVETDRPAGQGLVIVENDRHAEQTARGHVKLHVAGLGYPMPHTIVKDEIPFHEKFTFSLANGIVFWESIDG